MKKLKSAISKQVFAQKPSGSNRLDSLFSKGKAGGTPTSTNKEYYNGEIPFLSINDITKQGKYVRYTENHLSQSGLENSSAWVVPKYSLIMSMYASVGLVTINEIPITTSQAMFAMQLKTKIYWIICTTTCHTLSIATSTSILKLEHKAISTLILFAE